MRSSWGWWLGSWPSTMVCSGRRVNVGGVWRVCGGRHREGTARKDDRAGSAVDQHRDTDKPVAAALGARIESEVVGFLEYVVCAAGRERSI